MASISTDKQGNRRILFTDGSRKTIHLGKLSMKAAQEFKIKVEYLLSTKLSGFSLDAETAKWVSSISDVFADKLATTGLIASRRRANLGEFLSTFIATRRDIKPNTVLHLQRAEKDLLDFFGANKPLIEFSPTNADGFRQYLFDRGLAENTVRRICGRAKQFFRAAIRSELITSNPFADLVSNVKGNEGRFYFLRRDDADKILEACPDAEWRLIFALSRFGGLRCPSEHLALQWGHIDWEKNRILVPSPKTEHHEGRESRMIPLFPELRSHLEEVFEQAEAGTTFVITRYRSAKQNLRTTFAKIIRRAGLTPWPKLFQNLRSTRETELAESYPLHVVCAWIGNSQAVAKKHYLQVTDDHFAKAAQIPTQHPAEDASKPLSENKEALAIPEECEGLQCCTTDQAPRQGLEPWT